MTGNDPQRYINRELSWLDFNLRVLEEAQDPAIPDLERLKFLAITASNLDEFFMVRVGGLLMLARTHPDKQEPSGLTPVQQLQEIASATARMRELQYDCYLTELEPRLAEAGIRRVLPSELTEAQASVAEGVFRDQIESVLTPMAVRDDVPFPLLTSGTMNVCVELAPAAEGDGSRFAIIPFGRSPLRFVTLPADGGFVYLLAEDLIELFVQSLFPGEEITGCAPFRITRNADLAVSDDESADFLAEIEGVLDERRESYCVRLEVAQDVGAGIRDFLQSSLELNDEFVHLCRGPLDLSAFSRLTELSAFDALRYPDWNCHRAPTVDPALPLFSQLKDRDLLLYHPFECFDPVVRFIEEAAADSDVVAIKQTLYRTSKGSPIVSALMRASEQGKQVTALVELKARFDEARNIEWARQMEQSGVQVIYGVQGLKTHAKICAVIRREPHGFQRYVHFSTGNYNEITAKFYTDVSLLTCDEELGADAIACFNAVSGYSQTQTYRKLAMAPSGLRQKLMEMIHVERERCRNKNKGLIMAKLNSLVDPAIIDALYQASQAGVEVRLNVRGICCLRPGVPGLSENITVTSIIDRYLEHARILYFYHGGDERVFITSADWMPRNLDRRVELLVPVEDAEHRERLTEILEMCFRDTAKGRHLQPDGSWTRPPLAERQFRSQAEAQRVAEEAARSAATIGKTVFAPHRSADSAS